MLIYPRSLIASKYHEALRPASLPFDFNDPKRINSVEQTSKHGIELNPRSRSSMLVITAPRVLST